MARGRKPIGERALTAAERQRRRRARQKAAMPAPGNERRLRLDLWRFIRTKALYHPDMDAAHLQMLLEDLGLAIGMDAYCYSVGHGHQCDYQANYLDPQPIDTGEYVVFCPEPKKALGHGLAVLEKIDDMTPADLEAARERERAELEEREELFRSMTPEARRRICGALSECLGRPEASPELSSNEASNEASESLRIVLAALPNLTPDECDVVRQQLDIQTAPGRS